MLQRMLAGNMTPQTETITPRQRKLAFGVMVFLVVVIYFFYLQ